MTDLNPVLLGASNPLQGESVQNLLKSPQQTDFTNILSNLFAGTQTGSDGEVSSVLPALQKLVNQLSKDELKQLPDQALAWQELPPQGNTLPTLDLAQWLQQFLPTGGNIDPAKTLVSEEGTKTGPDGPAVKITASSLPSLGISDLKAKPEGLSAEEWLRQLTQQESALLKTTPAVAADRPVSDNVQAGNLLADNASRNLNGLMLQAANLNKTPLPDQQLAQHVNDLLNPRAGENANLLQTAIVSPQKEFKDLLRTTSTSELMIKLAGKIGSESSSANFHTGLEGLIKTGAESVLPKVDGTPGTLNMQHAMGKPEWATELGDKVVWMGKQEIKSAFLRLNPANLGPVEVRVSIHQDQTNVSFIAHQPMAREALEASIPRLREMMDASGFNLGNVDVSGRPPQGDHGASGYGQHANHAPSGHSSFRPGDEELLQTETLVQSMVLPKGSNSVDYFA